MMAAKNNHMCSSCDDEVATVIRGLRICPDRRQSIQIAFMAEEAKRCMRTKQQDKSVITRVEFDQPVWDKVRIYTKKHHVLMKKCGPFRGTK